MNQEAGEGKAAYTFGDYTVHEPTLGTLEVAAQHVDDSALETMGSMAALCANADKEGARPGEGEIIRAALPLLRRAPSLVRAGMLATLRSADGEPVSGEVVQTAQLRDIMQWVREVRGCGLVADMMAAASAIRGADAD